MNVGKILNNKGPHAPIVAPDVRVVDVIAALEAEGAGALVVSTDGLTIEGIISERDVVRGLQSHGASVLDQSVRDLMSLDVVTCTSSDRISGVMALMIDRNIRHVPILSDGKLAGIVSIRDIIALRLSEVELDAAAMRSYIGNS